MGLAEHVRSGAKLTRDTIAIVDSLGSGSINLGGTYIVLSIQNDAASPVRFRLYDTLESRDDATEISRVFGNTNVPPAITLVGDFTMSANTVSSIDPVVFGHSRNFANPITYYRMEPSGSQVKITRYLLEDSNIPADINTPYNIDNRRHLPAITGSLGVGGMVSGSLIANTIPTTYLLVSASLSNTAHKARLRLYSYSSSLYNTTEKTRPFATEPSASARLIADMIITGSENLNFSPKIIGANLANLSGSLNDIKNSKTLIEGEQEMYYILENANTTGGTVGISASLYVYALEG